MNPAPPTFDLDSVLPEYEPLSKAPSRRDVEKRANLPDEVEFYLNQERARRYKTVDRRGRVYLVANPAVLKEVTAGDGVTYKVRPAPKHVLTFEKDGTAREAG